MFGGSFHRAEAKVLVDYYFITTGYIEIVKACNPRPFTTMISSTKGRILFPEFLAPSTKHKDFLSRGIH
jgi:hypothetical protein